MLKFVNNDEIQFYCIIDKSFLKQVNNQVKIKLFMMNLQNRYDNCLSDILTLLQQAVYRFIADLEVDLTKFFQYFKRFHRNLVSLEGNFHQNKTKFSKYLSKIHHLTQQIDFQLKQKTISLEPQEKIFLKSSNSKSLKAQSISKKSNILDKTQQLNVIGQMQEKEDLDDIKLKFQEDYIDENQLSKKKRVGTAEGLRKKMSVTIDIHNTRPYTGSQYRQKINQRTQKLFNNSTKDRYKSLTKYEKTIDQQFQDNHPVQEIKLITEKKIFNLGQRKSIYDVLQQQKKTRKDAQLQEQFLKSGLIKLPQKRKKKNFSRWSFKIDKLL